MFTDAPPASLLSHCMITWPIYQCEMGLERRTGNEMNWMAVKALGQSALVVMWDIVNRLLLDCNRTFILLHFSSQVYLTFIVRQICMRECNIRWQLMSLTVWLYLKHMHRTHVTCVSLYSAATKADGFALYFLGECNNVSAEDVCWILFIHEWNCVHVFNMSVSLHVLVYASL